MTVEIRQVLATDAEGFHAAVDAVAREQSFLALTQAPPLEQVRAFVKRNVENAYPQILAIDQESVVGWCNIPPSARAVSAHTGEVFMGTLPAYRGQGLGTRLLSQALVAADLHGFERIELGVFATNVSAIILYTKAGFTQEGVKRRAIKLAGSYHDEVIMARLRT